MNRLAVNTSEPRRLDTLPTFFDVKDYLQKNPSSPSVILFSPSKLVHHSKLFQLAFPGEVSFAVKANSSPHVLQTLWESGIRSFDVASLGEVRQLRNQFPDSHLHFNNPVRSLGDTETAFYRHGVQSFVIDDQAGLDVLMPFLDQVGPGAMEITVRFKLEHKHAAYDFGSKFGADMNHAATLVKSVSDAGGLASLTFHPGSQCTDPKVYEAYVKAAALIASKAKTDLYRLNAGGGFPVIYDGQSVPAPETFFNVIQRAVAENFADKKPQILCEPGRALVASSCSLLTKVIHVRETGEVFLNDGIYGSLQEQMIVDLHLPLKLYRSGVELSRSGEERTIFGPTCDPLDRLKGQYQFCVDICAGDWVEFGLAGAYGSATATSFNGFDPAEYVVVERGFL